MANGIILSKNRIDFNSMITTTTGTATSVIYDRAKSTQWKSIGSNDTKTEIITINFGTNKTMSRLILLNHNIKSMELWQLGATSCQSFVNINKPYFYVDFFTFTASTVILKFKTTQVANQEKKIGEIILAEHYYDLAYNPSRIEYQNREQAKEISLADGTQKFWKVQGSDRHGLTLTFDGIPLAMCNQLETIKKSNVCQPFLLYLFPTEHPQEIYLMNWVNPFQRESQQAWDGAGNRAYSLKMELKEV